jgi:hypothetical protein
MSLRYFRNRDAVLAKYQVYNREAQRNLRRKLLTLLGGKCVRCGFDDPRTMQVDHVEGGGMKEVRSFGTHGTMIRSIYTRLKAGEDTEKYQLLCANCNIIKRFENGEGVVLDEKE